MLVDCGRHAADLCTGQFHFHAAEERLDTFVVNVKALEQVVVSFQDEGLRHNIIRAVVSCQNKPNAPSDLSDSEGCAGEYFEWYDSMFYGEFMNEIKLEYADG